MDRRIITVSGLMVLALVAMAVPAPARAARPTVSVSAIDKRASEDPVMADRAVFRIARTGSIGSRLRVCYAVRGTAQGGMDYRALSGTTTIPAGRRHIDISIRPVEDHLPEGDETVSLTLKRRSTYLRGVRRKATVVIRDETDSAYKVARIRTSETTIEYRLYFQENYEDQHFLTVIDDGRVFATRPHPGVDPNGWGTTVYLQPFLSGATLKHTTIQGVAAEPDKITVAASGMVSRGASATYGTWDLQLSFTYDKAAKKVTAAGHYDITLPDTLTAADADLNILKIASNYLREVPLLDGSTGDTGDMEYAKTLSSHPELIWIPWQLPSHFPMDKSDSFDITLVGDFNNVDTAKQGYEAIEPAYKPTVRIVLTSTAPNIDMITGYVFDEGKATQFWSDNVGVTPLVLKSSSWTDYSFDIQYESTALAGDVT